MFLTETKSNIKTIRPGDPDWVIYNGLMLAYRAGFEIDNSCPSNVKQYILMAIENEWLKPIAYQPVHEEFMEKLTK
jgi:hypothetical protein